jgi:hypothetical protein
LSPVSTFFIGEQIWIESLGNADCVSQDQVIRGLEKDAIRIEKAKSVKKSPSPKSKGKSPVQGSKGGDLPPVVQPRGPNPHPSRSRNTSYNYSGGGGGGRSRNPSEQLSHLNMQPVIHQ